MGMMPRWITEENIYANTQRTVDRTFLFLPKPKVRNIIGASAGRAQKKFPVKIYWLEFNSNHEQEGVAPVSSSDEHLNNVVRFKQLFHRLVAEELNRLYEREGPIFSTPARSVPCLDNQSLEQQFFYALTNPVKDGLVDKISHWKGFSSYSQLAQGKKSKYKYYNRTAWHNNNYRKPLEHYAKSTTVEFTPLPSLAKLSAKKREKYIRREVRLLEQKFREVRKLAGTTIMSKGKLNSTDPRDRPKSHAKKTPKPICHAATPEVAKIYKEKRKEFLNLYKIASALYRTETKEYFFPKGSYKPPLISLV